ncbi:MAG: NAD-dependent epimerase/dehydratase family protein [Prevotella sp.]|jgi:dihydroflavonol-4-reductase
MNILITGASGFIGSFIVEEALARGMETWAAVRPTSSRRYLQDSRIHFIELDLSSEERLAEQLRGHHFDYVVHAAGVTKCLNSADFYRVNTDGTRHLVNTLLRLDMRPRRFIYLSSLSIFGAIKEQEPYDDITESDTPKPNTDYGKSKLKAEQFLDSIGNDFNYIVLRPTGVYGPRERDYFLMVQSISRHLDFAAGFRRQDITFVYVKDVVQAIFLALDHGMSGRKYFLSDGKVYQSSTFSQLVREALGRPWCIRLTAPIWLLRLITLLGDRWGHLTGKLSALNNDKYHILRQRNWRCDVGPAMDELGFHPHYDLERGVKLTVDWYRKNGWI